VALLALAVTPRGGAAQEEPLVLGEADAIQVEDTAPPPPSTPPGSEVVEVRESHRTLAQALDGSPGVRVIRTGGEGAAWQLSIRGLQGRRVATYLGPVRLDDPVTGTLDLGEVPAAALQEAVLTRGASAGSEGGLGGVLRLKPSSTVMPVLRGSLQLASERALAGEVAAGAPTSRGPVLAGATVLGRFSTTQGRFSYTPVAGPADAPVVLSPRDRANNDRHRLGVTILTAGEVLGGPSASGVLDVTTMQGGLPGYGLTPLATARVEQTRVAAGVESAWSLKPWLVPSWEGSVRLSAWRFKDAAVPGGSRGDLWSASGMGGGNLALRVARGLWATGGLKLSVDGARTLGAAGGYDAVRPTLAGNLAVRAEPWDGRARVAGLVGVVGWGGMGRTGQAWEAPGRPRLEVLPEIRGEVDVTQTLTLHGAVSRAWRVPTMEEMHRPRDAVLGGNPGLMPEDGVEAGGGARLGTGPLRGSLSFYGARMANMIAWVNVNAFDIRPENVADVWRGGVELAATLDLVDWGRLEGGADVNWSYISATGRALPSAPMLEARGAALLGPPRARAVLEARARSGSHGNLFGELPVRPGARLDAGVVLEPFPVGGLTVRAMVLNVTGDRSQTDVWGVPQPGREFSVVLGLDPAAAAGGA
jgi:hypothetical protein